MVKSQKESEFRAHLTPERHPQVIDDLVKSTHRALPPSTKAFGVGFDIQETYCQQAAEQSEGTIEVHQSTPQRVDK